MGLPEIYISFRAKANNAIARSERGVVCVVVEDETAEDVLYTYKRVQDIDSADFTANNYRYICEAFHDGANKVFVVRIGEDAEFADIEATLNTLNFNWICYLSATGQSTLETYVKGRNELNPNKQVKAVLYSVASNDKHIVNFANASVKRVGQTAEAGYTFLARLCGLLAALPFTRSATYYIFDDLESVTEVADVDAAIEAGKLVIFNDYGEPKIARAVNSMTTVAEGETADMKKITIVEAMDLIKEDIDGTFKSKYIGKFKNNLDNQQIFISAVNTYFDKLAREEILDNSFDNVAMIDVDAQREALELIHPEAVDWDDTTVKRNTVGSKVFLAGQVKILDAIEDLKFNISIN